MRSCGLSLVPAGRIRRACVARQGSTAAAGRRPDVGHTAGPSGPSVSRSRPRRAGLSAAACCARSLSCRSNPLGPFISPGSLSRLGICYLNWRSLQLTALGVYLASRSSPPPLGKFISFGSLLGRLGICHFNPRSLPRLEFIALYHRDITRALLGWCGSHHN